MDVARHAGVSPMTVSRVINGESNVREETRDKVAIAIRKLGYKPNMAARSLATAQTLRIGLLYSNPSAAYLSEFLLGSLDQCSRSAVQLVVEKFDADDDDTAGLDELLASGVDGVIIPPPLCDSKSIVHKLGKARISRVLVATGILPPQASTVGIDDLRAAQSMTEHLLKLGHRRIGFIKGHPNHTASEQRLDGYMAALQAAGVEGDPDLIVQGFFTYHSGLAATEALLDLKVAPTAIFASNDDMAAAAISVAHRRGLEVPADLTVVGFDDTALATTMWPELTTIRQPVADMSRRAVLLLLAAIRRKNEGLPEQIISEVLDFDLIRRNSDGPPPAKGKGAGRKSRRS